MNEQKKIDPETEPAEDEAVQPAEPEAGAADAADIPDTPPDTPPDIPPDIPEETTQENKIEIAEQTDPAAEIAALNDKLLRALAEGENTRRRARREREDTAKYAIANFARDIVSVADNLSRALASLPEGHDSGDEATGALIDGVRLTERELVTIFERHGIERVDPMGDKFNHDLHEAMFELPTADAPPGTVVQVLEVGYLLKDRLLRAAKVAVARPPPPEPEQTEHVDTTV